MPSTSRLLRQRIDAEVADDDSGTDPNWRDRFRMADAPRYAEKPTLHIRCSPQFRTALDVAITASGAISMAAYVLEAVATRMTDDIDINLNDLPEFDAEVINFPR